MAYVVGSIPYFRCLVRREFTTNLARYAGEYIPAVAYGVRCMRGHSLWFQVMLMEPGEGRPNNTGGASFFLPIQALVSLNSEWRAEGNQHLFKPTSIHQDDMQKAIDNGVQA